LVNIDYDPSDGIWDDLKIVLDYMTIKDTDKARDNEKPRYEHDAAVYFAAKHNSGAYSLYADFFTPDLFRRIMPDESFDTLSTWVEHPSVIPRKYWDAIVSTCEPLAIANFEEKNNYYRMLQGKPFYGASKESYAYLSEEDYIISDIKKKVNGRYPAIHEMTWYDQVKAMSTESYQLLLGAADTLYRTKNDWSGQYLHYIGNDAIDLEAARMARDYDIIRLFPEVNSSVNRSMLRKFAECYKQSRDQIINTSYNQYFKNTTASYRDIVGAAIVVKALRLLYNRQFDGVISNDFFNMQLCMILFKEYNLPDISLLPASVLYDLAFNLPKLIRDRGTNSVLYDICHILGYSDVTIYRLLLVKQQLYDENNDVLQPTAQHATLVTNDAGDLVTEYEKVDDHFHQYERYFQLIDIKDTDPFVTILGGKNRKVYEDIVDPDPRWWEDWVIHDDYDQNENDPVKSVVFTKDYNYVETKYVMLEVGYDTQKEWYDVLLFLRYLLDKQVSTQKLMLSLPLYGKGVEHSIYDIVLFLVAGISKQQCQLSSEDEDYGQIVTNAENWRSQYSFNVDITSDELDAFLASTQYVNKDEVLQYIGQNYIRRIEDVSTAYRVCVIDFREYILANMSAAKTLTEYREYDKLYNMMYKYDPVRDIHKIPIDDKYEMYRIRYIIYDMECIDFGTTPIPVGSFITVTVQHVEEDLPNRLTFTSAVVTAVDENGIPTELSFKYPDEIDNNVVMALYNNSKYNSSQHTRLESPESVIKMDVDNIFDNSVHTAEYEYNTTSFGGEDKVEGTYIAQYYDIDEDIVSTVDGRYHIYHDCDLKIRIVTSRYHAGKFYKTYTEELLERDPILGGYLTDEKQPVFSAAMMEAYKELTKGIGLEIIPLLNLVTGTDKMYETLISMIKYLKHYTVDLTTYNMTKYIIKSKGNEGVRIFDGFGDGSIIHATGYDDLTITDAFGSVTANATAYDKTEGPRVVDRAMFQTNIDIPISYMYTLDRIVIKYLTLPENLTYDDYVTDTINICNRAGDMVDQITVSLHIGPAMEYADTGFIYNTPTISYPVYVKYQKIIPEEYFETEIVGGYLSHSNRGYVHVVPMTSYTIVKK
jgi:hypothetical protein